MPAAAAKKILLVDDDDNLRRTLAEQLALENERLASQAYLDGLTGLGNRFTLERQQDRLRAEPDSATVTVLLMDLDLFKPVNDTFGHAVGDEVLRRVADVLRAVCRPNDLAIRLGGDEFVLLLHGCQHPDGYSRAAQIRARVADIDWPELTPGITVGVSIGMATGPSTMIDTLLEQADQDMYRRKTRHRPAPRTPDA